MRGAVIGAVLALTACAGGVGTMPVLEVEILEDPAMLRVSTACARNVTARVIEAETEIVVTLDGDRLDDDCAGTIVLELASPAGGRFVRDGANGTVFGFDGFGYVRLTGEP